MLVSIIHANSVLDGVEHAVLLLASLLSGGMSSGGLVIIHANGVLGTVHDAARGATFVVSVLAAASHVGNFLSGGFVIIRFDTTKNWER